MPAAEPGRNPSPPSQPQSGGTLPAVLRRHWMLGLVVLVLAGVGAWTVGTEVATSLTRLHRPPFTARVLLSVAAHRPRILFTTGEVTADYATYQRTQTVLIRSRLVLNTALRNPRVAELDVVKTQLDPVAWLEERIQVDYPTGSEIMRISLSGDNPDEISMLITAVTDAYLQEIVNKEQTERLARLDQLKETSNRYEALLKDKRKALRALGEAQGARNPDTLSVRHKLQQEQLGSTRRKLFELKNKLHDLQLENQARQAQGRNRGEPVVPEEQTLEGIQKDPLVADYQAQIDKAERALELMESKSDRGDNAAALQRYKDEIKTHEAALVARKQKIRPRIEADLRQRARVRAADQVAQTADQIAFLSKMIELLEADEDRLSQADQNINKAALDLEAYKEEIAQAELVAKRIMAEIVTMDVELKAPQRIKLLDGTTVTPTK